MEKDKLTPKEEAFLAAARREAAGRSAAPAPAPAPAEPRSAPKPVPTAADRLAQIMEEERAETAERKRKMRRYGLTISGSILALFVLWVLSSLRRRR
jgi:hypothetical protein